MQIALCDDEERQLDLLEGFLRAYEAEHGMDLTLTRFSSGEALLGRRLRNFPSSLWIFIWTDFWERRPSAAGRGSQVVFITTAREHAIEAFAWGPSTIC